MAGDLLLRLGVMNLAAAVAVLLVLALRKPARRLLGSKDAYALWLLVPVVMLSVLIPARQLREPGPAALLATPDTPASGPAFSLAFPESLTSAAVDLTPWALGAWLAGAALFLAGVLYAQQRAIAAFGLVARDRSGAFRAANLVAGPALVGLLQPRLVLPSDFEQRFGPDERALILEHEGVHLKSGHLWINALGALVQALNWFNPLIHVAAHFARLDQELACDAAVVERFPGERRTYAQAMLKSQLARAPLPLGCAWPSRSDPALKERIEMLAINTPRASARIAGGLSIALLGAVAGYGAWAAQPPRSLPNPVAASPVSPPATPDAPDLPAASEPSLPADVCLTNACDTPKAGAANGQSKEERVAAILAAFATRDEEAVLRIAEGPDDVVSALTVMITQAGPEFAPGAAPASEIMAWVADRSDGSTLAYEERGDRTVIVRRNSDGDENFNINVTGRAMTIPDTPSGIAAARNFGLPMSAITPRQPQGANPTP